MPGPVRRCRVQAVGCAASAAAQAFLLSRIDLALKGHRLLHRECWSARPRSRAYRLWLRAPAVRRTPAPRPVPPPGCRPGDPAGRTRRTMPHPGPEGKRILIEIGRSTSETAGRHHRKLFQDLFAARRVARSTLRFLARTGSKLQAGLRMGLSRAGNNARDRERVTTSWADA